jgi:hypothetical protein
MILERDTGLEPVTPSLGSEPGEQIGQDSRGLERDSIGGTGPIRRDPEVPCTDAVLSSGDARIVGGRGAKRLNSPAAADAAIRAWLRAAADELAAPFLTGPRGQA